MSKKKDEKVVPLKPIRVDASVNVVGPPPASGKS